jgi:diguanylate cyclase (GGDEF)-like protein
MQSRNTTMPGTTPSHEPITRTGRSGVRRRLAAALPGRGRGSADPGRDLVGLLPLRFPAVGTPERIDDLTGLGGQAIFVDTLTRHFHAFERDGKPFSLVLLDLDDLERIDVRYGYLEGDQLLRRTARVLTGGLGPRDSAFRIGGDEFAVLLTGSTAEHAAQRVRVMLGELEDPRDDDYPGSFSAGVAAVPGTADRLDGIYRQAASALAWVKSHGRADVAVFDPGRPGSSFAGAASTHDDMLDRAVHGNALRPVFQPMFDLSTGRAVGFEGLIRLGDDAAPGTRGLFAAAAASGRTAELDLAALATIVSGARTLGPDHLLALNLSPRTLAGRDFEPTWLLRSLVGAGISPQRVIIELADPTPVDDLARLQRAIDTLHRQGLRFAADDVDVEDPAHRLLAHVPFDVVKIDLASVWEGARSGPRLARLRDAALGRRAHVVVEGVETAEQLVAARDLEIGTGQGFLLGRPEASLDIRYVDMRTLEGAAGSLDVAGPAVEVVGVPVAMAGGLVPVPTVPAARDREPSHDTERDPWVAVMAAEGRSRLALPPAEVRRASPVGA